MTYSIILSNKVDKVFFKLVKKDREQYYAAVKKIKEIKENPQHYKNLHPPLAHLKRVHIMKSFVLIFSVDEKNKIITLEDYEHHDKIYKI